MMIKVALAIKITDKPLYKILGDIPARSTDLTHASVRHYDRFKNIIEQI
jgi:hypothetical protein